MRKLNGAICGIGTDRRKILKGLGLVLAMTFLFMTGCTLVKLKEEVKESLSSTVLVGQIATAYLGEGKIVVAAYSLEDGERKIVNYTVIHEAGEYEVKIVAKGFKPHIRTYAVKPGRPVTTKAIELVPL